MNYKKNQFCELINIEEYLGMDVYLGNPNKLSINDKETCYKFCIEHSFDSYYQPTRDDLFKRIEQANQVALIMKNYEVMGFTFCKIIKNENNIITHILATCVHNDVKNLKLILYLNSIINIYNNYQKNYYHLFKNNLICVTRTQSETIYSNFKASFSIIKVEELFLEKLFQLNTLDTFLEYELDTKILVQKNAYDSPVSTDILKGINNCDALIMAGKCSTFNKIILLIIMYVIIPIKFWCKGIIQSRN